MYINNSITTTSITFIIIDIREQGGIPPCREGPTLTLTIN